MMSQRTAGIGTRRANSAKESIEGLDRRAPGGKESTRRRVPLKVHIARLVILFGFLALWEFASGRFINDLFISRPSEIIQVFWGWVIDGTLWYHASSTLTSAALGFAIGGAAAIIAGYVLGSVPTLAAVCEPFITAGYLLPKVALIPLFVMWVGSGTALEVTVSAVMTFFLMFYNIFYGVREVPQKLIDSVRIMGGQPHHIATQVRLPSALVWFVAGMKVSVPQALTAVVVAELLASNRGLGYLVGFNAGQFYSAGTFAALLGLLLIGLAVDGLVTVASRRALRWKEV